MKIRYSSLLKPNVAEDDSQKLRPLIERTPRRTSWEDALEEYEEAKIQTVKTPVEVGSKD